MLLNFIFVDTNTRSLEVREIPAGDLVGKVTQASSHGNLSASPAFFFNQIRLDQNQPCTLCSISSEDGEGGLMKMVEAMCSGLIFVAVTRINVA